jgi:MFS family permease
MTDASFSLVTSVFTVGGLLGSSVANLVMDRWGRRGAIRASALSVAIGGGLMGISASIGPFIVGRYTFFGVTPKSTCEMCCPEHSSVLAQDLASA